MFTSRLFTLVEQRSIGLVPLTGTSLVLRRLMPRRGQAHPIDDGWRGRVQRRLEEKGWNQADLARAMGVGRNVVTKLLKLTDEGGAMQSPLKPRVHEVLDWTPPIPPSLDEEAGEVLEMLKKMTPIERVRWLERGLAIIDESKRRK